MNVSSSTHQVTAAVVIVILEHLNDRQVSKDWLVELRHRRFRVALHCEIPRLARERGAHTAGCVLDPEYRLLGMCLRIPIMLRCRCRHLQTLEDHSGTVQSSPRTRARKSRHSAEHHSCLSQKEMCYLLHQLICAQLDRHLSIFA